MHQPNHIIHIPRPSRLLAYVNSRRRSQDIEHDTVVELLDNYGLQLTGQMRNLPVGRRNRNLDLDTSAGRKMLKGYRPQWQRETVTYAHSIVHQLAQLDFPAPHLVTTRTGSDFIKRDGTFYGLFDYVEGTNYSGSYLLRGHRQQLMLRAGRTLAHFHQTLKGFKPKGRHHMGFGDYTGSRWRDAAWHVAKVRELRERSEEVTQSAEQAQLKWLCRNSDYMLEEICRLDEVLSHAPLPRLVIHGDYGLHNLLFHDNGTIIVVDFELARLEWRLSDLVSCLSRYRFSRGSKVAYDFASIQWFMDGYQEVYPLSADEWQLLPQVWRFYRMQSAVQYWNSYFQTNGPIRKLYSARDAINQVDWARNYPHRLIALSSVPGSYSGPDGTATRHAVGLGRLL